MSRSALWLKSYLPYVRRLFSQIIFDHGQYIYPKRFSSTKCFLSAKLCYRCLLETKDLRHEDVKKQQPEVRIGRLTQFGLIKQP